MSGSTMRSLHDVRGEVRFPTRMDAILSWPGNYVSARILNISNFGMMVEGLHLPPAGRHIHTRAKGLDASGLIVWQEDENCGILLEEPIHALAVVREHFCARHRLDLTNADSIALTDPDDAPEPMRQARRWHAI